jgi:hypothetical protein
MLEFLRSKFQIVEFVKVVELTGKNQPHLHLVLHLGSNPLMAACESRAKYNARWLAKSCDCLEHLLSGAWHGITGDSYVVDVKDIGSGKKVANYLAKYMAKGITYKTRLAQLGFARSWARSRGWPFDQLRLAQTEKGWKHIEHSGPKQLPRGGLEAGYSVDEWLTWTEKSPPEREGTDLAWALAQEREDRGKFVIPENIGRMIFYERHSENDRSSAGVRKRGPRGLRGAAA